MKMVLDVLVEYDYIAKEPDELSIKRGDVIREVLCKKGGWWEGCLGNRRGVFPDNYVKVLDSSDQSVTLRSKADSYRIRKCRVVFSYRPAHEDELPLNVDDVVNIIGEEEEGWWRGRLHGREGVFPSNFVEEIVVQGKGSKSGSRESLNELEGDLMVKSPVLPPKPERLYEVKYAYTAENEDELTLCEGEVITLISKDGQDPGWWRGELNGRAGVFPDNFVVPLQNKNNQQVSEQRSSVTGGNAIVSKGQSELEHALTSPTTQAVLPISIKPSHIVQQRKSFEQKPANVDTSQSADNLFKGTTPPVLSKKPTVPKKSPSGSGSGGGGLFAGIKKKLADAVDGAASSKSSSKESKSSSEDGCVSGDNSGFDQVERNSMLPDVRASRAKAPRRRPPSVAFKDSTPPPSDTAQLTNGNSGTTDPGLTSSVVSSSSGGSLDMLPELDNVPSGGGDASVVGDEGQPPVTVRPKVREWEKHRAPWLEEMKASQAKRTSTSPGPEKRPGVGKGQQDGLDAPVTAVRTSKDGLVGSPLNPQRTSLPLRINNNTSVNNISSSPAPSNTQATPPQSQQTAVATAAATSPAIDMSRSMPALSGLIIKPTGGSIAAEVDKPMMRNQLQQQQSTEVLHTTVNAAIRTGLPIATDVKQKTGVPTAPGSPPASTGNLPAKITPPMKSLLLHTPLSVAADSIVATFSADRNNSVDAASGDAGTMTITTTGCETAAQQRIIAELLDRVDRLELESQMNKTAVEDLRGKLQVETDLRRLLQAELDKVSRCVMQV